MTPDATLCQCGHPGTIPVTMQIGIEGHYRQTPQRLETVMKLRFCPNCGKRTTHPFSPRLRRPKGGTP